MVIHCQSCYHHCCFLLLLLSPPLLPPSLCPGLPSGRQTPQHLRQGILPAPLPPPSPRHYRNPAHQRRVRGAWAVAGDCDLLLFLVDAARELQRPDPRIHRLLADSCTAAGLGMGDGDEWQPPAAVLVLNKCDAVPRPQRTQLLPLSDRLRKLRQFEDVFYISAKDGGCIGCSSGVGGTPDGEMPEAAGWRREQPRGNGAVGAPCTSRLAVADARAGWMEPCYLFQCHHETVR